MDAGKGNIYTIMNGSKQFIIPVYQRLYSWDIDQCSTLWNDIVSLEKEGKTSHFVGSIVNIAETAMPTGVQRFMIIDGQQRLTTLTLMMIALRNYVENHPGETDLKPSKIMHVFLKNEDETGEDQYKLLLTQADKDTLISLIEDKPMPDHHSIRIKENYEYFVHQIESMIIKPNQVYDSIGRLQIVNITLDRDSDDPQAIFESLNSTGKELSQSDLIRNNVLMGLDSKTQSVVYNNVWRPMETLFSSDSENVMDAFFRDYLTMKELRIPRMRNVYDEFKIYRRDNADGFTSTKELCEELYKYARYYTDLVYCNSDDNEIKNLYSDAREMRMDVAYPFLLRVHSYWDDGKITRDEYVEILRICISYVFRRNICNIPTNSLNKTFATTLPNSLKMDDLMNSIRAFFVLADTYKRMPTDEEFKREFKTRDIYHMHVRSYIFRSLEDYNNKAPIVMKNYSIEHIMPQNENLSPEWQADLGSNWKEIQEKYLHTIGNLTLTAYNPEMSDNPFMYKMTLEGGFKESALRLNSYVIKQTTWNEDKIKERADQLTDLALKIWQYPKITDSELALYKAPKKKTAVYTISNYDLNAFNQMLYEQLNRQILNISADVTRDFKKMYIAYKLDTNFVDIVVGKDYLQLYINLNFDEVKDPKEKCENVTQTGHHGNGNISLRVAHSDEIDYAMTIIQQAYDKQANS
jgi:uncharacterized protein with ParB-like and HNH nuclease domain/predicted transport protein